MLVPFPQATDNHQEHNAHALVEAHAALLLREREWSAASLTDALAGLLADPGRLAAMRTAMLAAALRRPGRSTPSSPRCVGRAASAQRRSKAATMRSSHHARKPHMDARVIAAKPATTRYSWVALRSPRWTASTA